MLLSHQPDNDQAAPKTFFDYSTVDEWHFIYQLDQSTLAYIWEQVEVAKGEDRVVSSELAGCISKSLAMKDPQGICRNTIAGSLLKNIDSLTAFRDYLDLSIRQNPFHNPDNLLKCDYELELWQLWVNFQSQTQYNPLHNHSGFLSFVIWLKVPYDHKDLAKLAFIKESNASETVGNFFFFGRNLDKKMIIMNPSIEGFCAIFPSSYRHQVFPFYDSQEMRISVSGNLGLKIVH